MRIIDLDFYADKGGSIFLGYAGEHLSTVLNFHMPAELGNNDCVYVISFLEDGEDSGNTVSHLAFKTRFDTNIVEYYIPSAIMGSGTSTGVFHLEAYGATTTDNNEVSYSILGKSTEFRYVIDDAIATNPSGLNITLTSSEEIALSNLIAALETISDIEAALGNLDTLIDTLDAFMDTSNDLSEGISTNATNISNLSTKIGSDTFDDSTKINGVIPNNLMDALKKISAALTSLNNDKINKANAIKYETTTTLDSCVEAGTVYRYTKTTNGSPEELETGDYTVIPSFIPGTGNLTQYIFSTKGEIYCRNKVSENGSYTYTLTKILSQKNVATAFNDTTLSNTNRNKMLPTIGAVDDYIKELSERGNIGGKDFIMNYNIGVQNWTYISQNNLHYYTINTSIFDNKYTITENTKIDIEPSIELITKLEEGFCMGIYIENNMPTDIRLYVNGYEHANPSNINNINIVLKLSEVRYNNN